MSGFIGGGSNAAAKTKFTQLSIQTSAQGVPIPIVWGRKRMGVNLIWYGDFVAIEQGGKKGGGKGGGGKGSAVYKYRTAVMLGLCEGPITGIGTVWADRNTTTLADLGLTLFTGTPGQAPWSYLTSRHPAQALSYAYTAYVADSSYDLGYSPNLPNHSFEIISPLSGSMPGTPDVNLADVLPDLLTNPQYAVAMPGSSINSADLAQFKAYCQAQGLLFSPDLTSQEPLSQVIDRWARISNSWIFWSGPNLRIVPLGDAAITTGDTFSVSVTTTIPVSPGPYTFAGTPTVTADGGVKRLDGTSFTSAGGAPASGQYHYASGVWTFNSADAGTTIVVTYTYSYAGPTYTPVLTSRYDFTYEDFLKSSDEPPIEVTRNDPADAPNHVRLEICNRANGYNSSVAEWKDQALADQYGVIDNQLTQAHEICDTNVGQMVAQLVGQRDAYIRNTYAFRVGWEFFLLEPGDVVTLTDVHMGLSKFAVRIRTMDEDEAGNWSIIAEEFPGGIGTVAGTQPAQLVSNTPLDTSVDPGPVNKPAVFEPSAALTSTGSFGIVRAQVWIAASGGIDWGGAVVYISFDNVNFAAIGTISAAAAQGVLTSGLPNHADPDFTNTLSVDFTESAVVLDPDATTADADERRTLSIIIPAFTTTIPGVGVECLTYGNTVATGTYSVALTYLRRGLYGTSPASHASGDFFTRLDLTAKASPGNSILVYELPPEYIGQLIYLKFCSFNRFGGALEDISAVTTYTYSPTGAGYGGGTGGVPTTPTGLTASAGIGQVVLSWTNNPATDTVDYYAIYAAPGLSQPFSSAVQIGTSASPNFIDTGLTPSSAWTFFIRAHNTVGLSTVTAGVNATVASTQANLFRLSGNLAGAPSAGQVLFEVEMVGGEGFAASLPGSVGGCDVAPSGAISCTLSKNGSSIGSMNIAAGATAATYSFPSTVSFVSGDLLTFTAPASVDATLAGLHYTLLGTR